MNGQIAYHFARKNERFNPYVFAGGGFIEFKSFTTDVYGLACHMGIGSTIQFSSRLHGLFETRYFNLGQLELGGKNELAVFWGDEGKVLNITIHNTE